jgi:hypothetical protein
MMPLSELLFLGIVLYVLYKFIFNFFLPIFRTTKHVRQQFRNMQGPGQNQEPGSAFQRSHTRPPEESQPKKQDASSKNSMGEYIDFEEIKK